jgi:hypothetical protein
MRTSESSFTAMFSWSHKNKIKITEKDGFLYRLADVEKPFYLFPLGGDGDHERAMAVIEQDAKERGYQLIYRAITEDQKDLMGNGFAFTENRGAADYIYNAQDLIELRGRAYHSKRNFISRFERENDWSFEGITDDNINEVWEFQDKWCRKNDCASNVGLQEEATCIAILLYNLENLEAYGGLLRADGKVAAFTLGSQVGGETLEVHVEKADYEITGVYQMINREFAKCHAADLKYINREEDLGLENLRKAKLSYHPIEIAMKYSAVKL